ncbi:serine hydrolase [Microlunatus endophyticus]|uniref:Serine hydrolase n=1 Tax=Microlunatus endophyticus TaxID=1716077 RepID=A0A917SIR8_9ACTN|nr:serine hydrolase domain-containing protein [Microlunatus endophyticus]GGL80249.1 serine hydrolase [Microlunatus endophyticus]
MTNTPTSSDDQLLDRYRATLPYIDSWAAYKTWQLRVPGVQVAIGHRDEVLFSTAYGSADVEKGVRLGTGHLFRIASHSKTFTATALAQLVEAGKLRFDDPVGQYIPQLAAAGSPIADATVRELAEQSAGVIRDGLDSDHWQLAQPFPDEEKLLDLVLDHGTKTPVGSKFNYSNLGYSLLGLVVAAASGQSYRDYVKAEIIDKLGLANTGPDFDKSRPAEEWVRGYSGLHAARTRKPIDHVDTHAMSSATGFYSTAEDLVHYFSAHLPGDDRLLTDHSKWLLQHEAWKGSDKESSGGYGIGFGNEKVDGTRVVGHSGGFPGHITQSLFEPESGVVVSVLTNCAAGPASVIGRGILSLLFAAADESAPGTPLSQMPADVDPATVTGRFAGNWGVADIAVVGDRLLQIDPGSPTPLELPVRLEITDADTVRATAGSRFGAIDEDIRYLRDTSGAITSVRNGGGMSMTPWDVPGDEDPLISAGVA